MQTLSQSSIAKLNWVHTALNSLPIDEKMSPETRQVRGANYSLVRTTPVENPKIVSICDKAMREALDVSKEDIMTNQEDWAEILSGNEMLEGSTPISH